MFLFTFICLLFPIIVLGDGPTLCDIVNIPNCEGITKQARRNSMGSLPSTSSAANLNPANVSFDRGLGIEAIAQSGNSTVFNLATGTGKLGGALISSNVENGFFGNRTIESNEKYLSRNRYKKQFPSKKLTLALGRKVINQRKYALDAGVILKSHSQIRRINPGFGLSGRFQMFSFGASYYQDDFFLRQEDRPQSITKESYAEKFMVTTYSAGVRIMNFSFDAGIIRSKIKFWDDETFINLYSASYRYKHLLLNVAKRLEASNMVYFENDTLTNRKYKNEVFGSLQVSLGKYLIAGIAYNYFLLRETSFNASLYF